MITVFRGPLACREQDGRGAGLDAFVGDDSGLVEDAQPVHGQAVALGQIREVVVGDVVVGDVHEVSPAQKGVRKGAALEKTWNARAVHGLTGDHVEADTGRGRGRNDGRGRGGGRNDNNVAARTLRGIRTRGAVVRMGTLSHWIH